MEPEHQLVRLAFWLTGDPEATIDAVTDAIGEHDAAQPFFESWMKAWARKLVIGKALGKVHSQMETSIHRTRMLSTQTPPRRDSLPPPTWSTHHEVSNSQLEDALLAIDLFPRCVFILLIFEKLSLDEAATLLNTDKHLVKEAEEIALTELARNIALKQGWAPLAAVTASWMDQMHPA